MISQKLDMLIEVISEQNKSFISGGDIINICLLIVTLIAAFIAYMQLQANSAPRIIVSRNFTRMNSKDPKHQFGVEISNKGNGLCLDAVVVAKEKDSDGNIHYHLSKFTRELNINEKAKVIIYTDHALMLSEIEYMVIYKDFFGRTYLASDVFNNRRIYPREHNDVNKHLEHFSNPAKVIRWYNLINKRKYKDWMKRAIREGNTYKQRGEKSITKLNEVFKGYDPASYFHPKEKDITGEESED